MNEPNSQGGWFAYAPHDSDDAPDTPIEWVELRVIEHAGPFWSQGECLSEDFDELHSDLGISRELYDDIMEWHASSRIPTKEHIERGHELTSRLAGEVSGMEVRPLRERGPGARGRFEG
jgi:hypothetical protein